MLGDELLVADVRANRELLDMVMGDGAKQLIAAFDEVAPVDARRRPLLLLWGGGREGTVVVSDMRRPLVSRLTTVPSAELASVEFAVLAYSPLWTWAWVLPRRLLASVLTSMSPSVLSTPTLLAARVACAA